MTRAKAHALIERRYVEKGETTRIVVMPLEGSGLPEGLVSKAEPLPIDLLSGRPVDLHLDGDGLSASLCFNGPPVRCTFPWSAIIAVQAGPSEDTLEPTVTVTVAVVMEDGSLEPVRAVEDEAEPVSSPEPTRREPRSHLRVVPDGE